MSVSERPETLKLIHACSKSNQRPSLHCDKAVQIQGSFQGRDVRAVLHGGMGLDPASTSIEPKTTVDGGNLAPSNIANTPIIRVFVSGRSLLRVSERC